eukprot:12338312-Heterocapsa_arctica.AAC.1
MARMGDAQLPQGTRGILPGGTTDVWTSERIGEAVNPGPGADNKQLRHTKMGYYFGGAHPIRDEKAEWCREKGLEIQSVREYWNCLYTCLGSSKNMEASQVRAQLLDRVRECWSK